jgi:16S rRNA (cytidine1402-2'-O)-methyltransferase
MPASIDARYEAVSIHCRGHPQITGSHANTFEVVTDPSLTSAGTCIVGVSAEFDQDALLRLRGAVKVTVRCGEAEDIVFGLINPRFRRGDPLIFRRDPRPQPRAICIACSKGAANIDRALIQAARKADVRLDVTIEPLSHPGDAASGVLYVVGTPIGDAQDMSWRAVDVLQSVDLILAEDTRTTADLLGRLGIRAHLMSYHDYNERERIPAILQRLTRGGRIALVSEAGMPLISDPGFHVVRAAIAEGILVTPVPGPDAVTTALSVAGLSPVDFRFLGFLPAKSGARRARLREVSDAPYTLICFEAPHRIVKTLSDLDEIMPGRRLVMCRNLTKHTEQVMRGDAKSILDMLAGQTPQGELTIVVDGASKRPAVSADQLSDELIHFVRELVASGVPSKVIASALAAAKGISRRDAFALAVSLKDRHNEPS